MPNILAALATRRHAAQHANGANDEISLAGLSGAVEYVSRGDPAAVDKATGDFTKDGDFHDLDLSAIVPAGATAIQVRVSSKVTTTGKAFVLRKKGLVNAIAMSSLWSVVINLEQSMTLFVACDANRVIEYRADGGTWTILDMVVVGWLIPVA